MDPKALRDLATERRQKLGNRDTRLAQALDGAAAEIERLRAAQLSPEERNRLRQWYNALDDTNPNFLEDADRVLALKIVGAEQKENQHG